MSLDGTPVFEGGLVIPFVVRLVTMFAPTVREIAKRSPNEFELSLKQENDGGRREEIYLRKEQLVSKLQPLSSIGREVFAPLGLDSWVPGLTTAPPPVVSRLRRASGAALGAALGLRAAGGGLRAACPARRARIARSPKADSALGLSCSLGNRTFRPFDVGA